MRFGSVEPDNTPNASETNPANNGEGEVTPADVVPQNPPEVVEEGTVIVRNSGSEAGPVVVFTPPEEHTGASATAVYVPFSPETAAVDILGASNCDATAIVIAEEIADAEPPSSRGLTWWQSGGAMLIAALTALAPFSSRRRVERAQSQDSRLRLHERKT